MVLNLKDSMKAVCIAVLLFDLPLNHLFTTIHNNFVVTIDVSIFAPSAAILLQKIPLGKSATALRSSGENTHCEMTGVLL